MFEIVSRLANRSLRGGTVFLNIFIMKKLILGLGVLALSFASIMPASAICRNPDGSIDTGPNGDTVYSANNLDGSCSNCDYTCSMPILSGGY